MCVSYYVVYQCGCIGPSRLEECSAYWEDECECVIATPQLAPHKCNACRKKSDRRADPGFGEPNIDRPSVEICSTGLYGGYSYCGISCMLGDEDP